MQGKPVALAHEAADPAKSDDGKDAGLGLWTHAAAVHKLPVCQHLQANYQFFAKEHPVSTCLADMYRSTGNATTAELVTRVLRLVRGFLADWKTRDTYIGQVTSSSGTSLDTKCLGIQLRSGEAGHGYRTW